MSKIKMVFIEQEIKQKDQDIWPFFREKSCDAVSPIEKSPPLFKCMRESCNHFLKSCLHIGPLWLCFLSHVQPIRAIQMCALSSPGPYTTPLMHPPPIICDSVRGDQLWRGGHRGQRPVRVPGGVHAHRPAPQLTPRLPARQRSTLPLLLPRLGLCLLGRLRRGGRKNRRNVRVWRKYKPWEYHGNIYDGGGRWCICSGRW